MKHKIIVDSFVKLICHASICCLIFFLSSNYSLADEYDFIDFSTSGNGTGPSIMRDAKSFIDSHQYYKANKEFARIIEFYNGYNSYRVHSANIFLGRSLCDVDVFECKKAIMSYAGEAHLGRGICFIEILQHEKAISELSSSIRLFNKLGQYDKTIWAYYCRGYSYSQSLDFTHAFQDLSKAISLLEDRYPISKYYNKLNVLKMHIYTLYERGLTCYKKSFYKQAIVDFSKIISIGGNLLEGTLPYYNDDYFCRLILNAAPRYWRGMCFLSTSEEQKAMQDLSISIMNITNLMQSTKYIDDHAFAVGLYIRGNAYCQLENAESAINDFDKAIQYFSNTDNKNWLYKSLFSRGKCYSHLGKRELASIDTKKAMELNTASSNFNIDESKTTSSNINIDDDDSKIKRNTKIQETETAISSNGLIKYLIRPFFAKINGKNKLIPNEEAFLVEIENKKILFPYKNVSISLENLKDGEEIIPKAIYAYGETECRLLIKAISDVEIKHIFLFGAPLSPTKVKVIVEPKLRKEFQFESFIPSSIKFEKLDFSIITKGDRNFEFTLHIEKNKDTEEPVCNIKAKQSIKNLADEL